jgi:hypothetical protein
MTFPEVSKVARTLAAARRGLLETEADEYMRHVQACALSVSTAVKADIENGVLPSPDVDPASVEDDIYHRAAIQALDSPYIRNASLSDVFAILQFSETLPSYVTKRSVSEQDFTAAMRVAINPRLTGNSPAMALLQANTTLTCEEANMRIGVDWKSVGMRLLQNMILIAMCRDEEENSSLKLNLTGFGSTRRSPIWVGEYGIPALDPSKSEKPRHRS